MVSLAESEKEVARLHLNYHSIYSHWWTRHQQSLVAEEEELLALNEQPHRTHMQIREQLKDLPRKLEIGESNCTVPDKSFPYPLFSAKTQARFAFRSNKSLHRQRARQIRRHRVSAPSPPLPPPHGSLGTSCLQTLRHERRRSFKLADTNVLNVVRHVSNVKLDAPSSPRACVTYGGTYRATDRPTIQLTCVG